MSRASTLLLALLILNVLLGSLCLAVARGERRSQALRLWAWGLFVYSLGLLVTLPDFLPFDLRKIVGNSLIAYAPILSIEGVLANTSWRLNRRWTTVGFVATVVPILVNHLGGHYRVLVDILAPAPIANVLFLLGTTMLVRRPTPDARAAARFVAATLLASVVVWTVRMVAIGTSVGATNDRDRADLIIALFAIAQIVISVAATLGLLWIEVRKIEAALRRQADTDALTGLANRRAAIRRCQQEVARAARYGTAFAVAVFDIDHFKQVNDTHGHQTGDRMLMHVATVLQAASRVSDTIGRIGGEEFVALLTEQSAGDAVLAAGRLRDEVGRSPLRAGALELAVTMSGGLAVYPRDGEDWDQLYMAADRRLYAAKVAGRDRLEAPDLAAAGTAADARALPLAAGRIA